jgi:putative glutamine amidotransferase
VRITPSRHFPVARLQGLVIGGGTDVDPFHYGHGDAPFERESHSRPLDWLVGIPLGLARLAFATGSSQDYDPDRDRLESSLLQHALYHDLPVLGICRGAQLMNVVLGGTLHRAIEHFYSEETGNVRSVMPRKRISIDPCSHLAQVLQAHDCVVNALHEQSIDVPGDGVVVTAQEQVGVVQAIERSGHDFFIGVQWHPEYMPQSATQRRLFSELVRRAGQSG